MRPTNRRRLTSGLDRRSRGRAGICPAWNDTVHSSEPQRTPVLHPPRGRTSAPEEDAAELRSAPYYAAPWQDPGRQRIDRCRRKEGDRVGLPSAKQRLTRAKRSTKDCLRGPRRLVTIPDRKWLGSTTPWPQINWELLALPDPRAMGITTYKGAAALE